MVHLKLGNIPVFVKRVSLRKLVTSRLYWGLNCQRKCYSSSSAVSLFDSDFVVKSPLPHVEAVTDVTIPEFLWHDLSSKENANSLECGDSGRKLTHGDVYRQSRSFAAALIQSGLKQGDVVGVILPNSPEFVLAALGVLEVGGIVSTFNPAYTEEEVIRQITKSEAKMIITRPEYLAIARAAKKNCPSLKSIVIVGPTHDDCHTFSEMVKVNSGGVSFFKGSQINATNDVAFLPFSSGTTGPPKGVELTHSNICTNIKQFAAPDVSFFRKLGAGVEQERLIGVLPFFHIYGLLVLALTNHYLGSNLLCISKFKPDTFIQHMKSFRPTTMTLVTPLISFIANSPELSAKDFASVECVQAGAAPVGTALINKLFEKAGKPIFFQELYGLTELSPACLAMNPSKGNSKLGSCGTLLPGTLGRIADPNTGKNLGPKERGEICIKGPQVMKGYFKNKEATDKCVDKDGWFYTGDIGYYDEDGCFYIVDRLKELIKVKGFQVAPAELEDLLRKIPDVVDVAVIGVPDEMSGELPRAYVVRKSDALTEAKINSFIEGKVAKFKELKGGIEFVSDIPKAASGKILRRELKAAYISKFSKN